MKNDLLLFAFALVIGVASFFLGRGLQKEKCVQEISYLSDSCEVLNAQIELDAKMLKNFQLEAESKQLSTSLETGKKLLTSQEYLLKSCEYAQKMIGNYQHAIQSTSNHDYEEYITASSKNMEQYFSNFQTGLELVNTTTQELLK